MQNANASATVPRQIELPFEALVNPLSLEFLAILGWLTMFSISLDLGSFNSCNPSNPLILTLRLTPLDGSPSITGCPSYNAPYYAQNPPYLQTPARKISFPPWPKFFLTNTERRLERPVSRACRSTDYPAINLPQMIE
jgi:hypothetical protein